MKIGNKIFLPGTDKQFKNFAENAEIKDKSVLIIGAGNEETAKLFSDKSPSEIFIIVDEDNSLIQTRLNLSGSKNISVRLMDFTNTDFKDEKFDIVYSQGSSGTTSRNKIIKDIFRILKPGGLLCTGEIIKKEKETPAFVKDIWQSGGLAPLTINEMKEFYEKKFQLIFEKDLSLTLNDFYQLGDFLADKGIQNLDEEERKFYKKMLNRISHESNAYLKLGGDRHIGFYMMILKKDQ